MAIRAGRHTRFLLATLAGGLPATVTSIVLLHTHHVSTRLFWTASILLVATWAGVAWFTFRRLDYRLRTLANIISALREGDFSFRLRRGGREDAFGELTLEINALAEALRAQRLVDTESTTMLRTVLGEIDVAVFSFDSHRRLRLVNRAGERLIGRTAEQITGRTADELSLDSCLDGEPARTLTLDIPDAGGRWELRRGVFRHLGRPHHLVILSDVSRALRAEEVAAWKRLIRVMGHELNNSLAPIKSLSVSLEEITGREPLADDWREDLHRGLRVIGSRADSLNRFMGAYSTLARLPQPTPGPVEVAGLVRRAAEMETRLKPTIAGGPSLTIRADRDQLEQLLINLVRNAADASLETGGTVRIEWAAGGDLLELSVLDEGPGLPDTANLFVPFFTTKPGGSGVGLFLCRQIAEAHGGSLQLSNRTDGPGCTALLRLPL